MLEKIITKLTLFALRYKKLSGEQKALLISELLKNLNAFPIRDIISVDATGTLMINGKKLDAEQSIQIRESGSHLKNSFVRKLIHDQMIFKAINIGVHNGLTSEQVLFSKAALWVIQEEDKLIQTFTGELSTLDDEL